MMSQQNKQAEAAPFVILFGIAGALLGMPLSYYFQDPMIRHKVPFGMYIENIPKILGGPGADPLTQSLFQTMLLTVLICLALGAGLGFFAWKMKENGGTKG